MVGRYTIQDYITEAGDIPYKTWLQSLRDKRGSARIAMVVSRMEDGNFGDSKGVGDGVIERRLAFGSGYRVYYARYDSHIVLLLCGGAKNTQVQDIERAKTYKRDYESRCL